MTIELLGFRISVIFFRGIEWPAAQRVLNSPHLDTFMDRAGIEKISKALADETRLRIFEAISAKRMTCGEIVSMRGVTPATVSHHLKILSEAGLIACRREGQFVHSNAVPETITSYTEALAKIARAKKPRRKR
jgi:ArsR family transcriptional regulator, arsenate/arsenite/antimonite-responsive transcriptional repressor